MSSTFLFALLSASSRSALNLFDRHLYATRRRSVSATMVVNLALPLAVCLAAAVWIGGVGPLCSMFVSFSTLVPAVVIQLVSYAYAGAFKRSPILGVVLCSKVGELLIPIALLPWTGLWRPADYLFYVLAFAAFLPVLRRGGGAASGRAFGVWALWVAGATVFQAVVFHLQPPGAGYSTFEGALLFQTAVLVWRVVLSAAVLVARPRTGHVERGNPTASDIPWLVARGVCFVATQATFFLALQQPDAHLAWPVLNSTSLLSALAAAWLLKERLAARELVSLVLLTAVVLVRMV